VGVSVVNALSDFLELNIRRDGKLHRQEYRLGEPQAPLAAVGDTTERGTTLRFKPSALIFTHITFNYDSSPSACVNCPSEFRRAHRTRRRARREVRGLSARRRPEGFRQSLEPQQDRDPSTCCGSRPRRRHQVEVAMQWNDSYQESMYCYTNNIPQKDAALTSRDIARRSRAL